MARYGQAFKNKVIAKLLPPNTASLVEISREVGVSTDTLERWRAESLTTPARERAWSAAARLSAVITTAAMDESSRSAWCRENGVYPQELDAWRTSATQALAAPEEQHASRVIGDWIGFYNHRRPHQALNMRTPAEAFALAA